MAVQNIARIKIKTCLVWDDVEYCHGRHPVRCLLQYTLGNCVSSCDNCRGTRVNVRAASSIHKSLEMGIFESRGSVRDHEEVTGRESQYVDVLGGYPVVLFLYRGSDQL